MTTISTNYSLIWQFKNHPHIQVDKNGNVVNTKTSKKKKMCVNGGSIGLWLDAKTFITKSKLNHHLTKIKKQNCPF